MGIAARSLGRDKPVMENKVVGRIVMPSLASRAVLASTRLKAILSDKRIMSTGRVEIHRVIFSV